MSDALAFSYLIYPTLLGIGWTLIQINRLKAAKLFFIFTISAAAVGAALWIFSSAISQEKVLAGLSCFTLLTALCIYGIRCASLQSKAGLSIVDPKAFVQLHVEQEYYASLTAPPGKCYLLAFHEDVSDWDNLWEPQRDPGVNQVTKSGYAEDGSLPQRLRLRLINYGGTTIFSVSVYLDVYEMIPYATGECRGHETGNLIRRVPIKIPVPIEPGKRNCFYLDVINFTDEWINSSMPTFALASISMDATASQVNLNTSGFKVGMIAPQTKLEEEPPAITLPKPRRRKKK